MSRRTILTAAAAIVAAPTASACAAEETAAAAAPSSKTLVAYFTRSGNTRVIAGQLHRELEADIFEIEPADAYPEDYEETVEKARQERDAGVEPPLLRRVPGVENYELIYLAFPIWGGTAPPIIRSFLRGHDLSGKTMRPVITHGGYGLGNSIAVLRDHAPDARHLEPFSMEADQERKTMTEVRGWISSVR